MFRIFSQYVSIKSFLLLILESFLIVVCMICAVKVRFWNDPVELAQYEVWPDFEVQIALVVLVCLICFYFNDLYNLKTSDNPMERILRVEQSLGTASLLLGLFYFLFPGMLLSRYVFLIGMLLIGMFLGIGRRAMDKVWQLSAPMQRVAILGTGPLALELARELTLRGDLSMRVAGFLSTSPLSQSPQGEKIFGFPVLGSTADLEAIASDHALSRIVVALEDRRGALPTRELVSLRVKGLRVEDAATALSALTGRIALHVVKPSWFVFSDGFHRSRWNEVLKRALDLAVGIVGIIVALPLMILVAISVRLESKGAVIYRQMRVGRRDKCFELVKFRSMCMDAEKASGVQWASENDPRVTRIGRFLRKYRLDEMPQFWNVIRGDMSFVGPRPERPHFVEDLRQRITYYDERHSVRPGLTGWAQVQYSYGSSVEDAYRKLEYDLFYLKNMSLTFDLAIILKTIKIVAGGHGGR
jgi:sugar transferase (PEP-CTERM system associated)